MALKISTEVARKRHNNLSRSITNGNKMTCAPIEDSDQPGHLPSLIRVFAVYSVGSYLRTHGVFMRTVQSTSHFVGFFMLRLNLGTEDDHNMLLSLTFCCNYLLGIYTGPRF